MKFLTSLVVFSALVSCGPAPELKKRAPMFETEDKLVVLSEKADRSVIENKYQNKINFRCDFIIDNKPDANITLANSFFFSVNLAAGNKPINLSVKKGNQTFTVGFRVKQFDILPAETYPHESGYTYLLKNSPVLEVLIRGREINGRKDQKFDRTMVFHENVAVTINDLFPKKYPHLLKCEVQTVIPAKYSDEFVIVAPTKENPETAVAPSPDPVSETNPTMEETTGPNP